ncbi:hypothetical protein [Nocardioides lijunqiniae]|uniref:hypothetical protein n=1 Tax=Nocardioides lijunqiniae TaxID=2760832 RepID=UPI0018785812|nr:hypothetical protein [Nocardioides lijunqiniae]
MTAYSSSALGDLMDDVLDNAVRRYVSEFGWYGSADEGFRGNNWDGELPPNFGPTGMVTLKLNAIAQSASSDVPPGAQYVGQETRGSVVYHVYEVDAYESIYSPWVDRLHQVFDGWRSLPDPADFDAPIAALEDAVDAITPQSQREGGYTFVDVEVSTAMGLIYKWASPQSDQASSDLLYAFDGGYGVDRITGVMVNQAQVAAGAGLAVAGEKQVWKKARTDIMAIAQAGADSLDIGGGGSGSIDLGVVKAFVDLVGVFVPAQFDVLVDAASEGLAFLDEVTPEPKTGNKTLTLSGGTAEEIFASLEDAVKELEQAIYDEESELQTKLQALQGILGDNDPVNFHLHPGAGMAETFVDAAEIRINSRTIQSIGNHDVPIVAKAFLRAAEFAASHTGSGIWSRDHSIGMGSYGPHASWLAALEQLDAITTGSAKELIDAGRTLAVAAGWIEDADDQAAADMGGLADELARGQDHWAPA